MPLALLGGASINVDAGDGEQLWAVGGGNGSALPYTLVPINSFDICHPTLLYFKVLSKVDEHWAWQAGPQLNEPRYAHCAALVEVICVPIYDS